MHSYEYPRPALTVDVALVRGSGDEREILLVRRGHAPFKSMWAMPGGFVGEYEPLEDAARRELVEETGMAPAGEMAQIGAFGDPGRDPRGWLVTVAFLARAEEGAEPVAGDDAADVAWHPVAHLPPLASDHARIVAVALERAALLGW